MAEEVIRDFQEWTTVEGEIRFGDVMPNNSKMAVMIRRIFPTQFKNSQYIGLQMGGELDGSVIISAPRTFSVKCGESPVGATGAKGTKEGTNGVASIITAENGDIILHAPNGRVRIVAQDIDLVAQGDGTKTGYINESANGGVNGNVNNFKMECKGSASVSGEKGIDLNTPGRLLQECGNYKLNETPDVNLLSNPFAAIQGNQGPLGFLNSVTKLIESIPL